ncbi:hypothetical protein MUN89_06140 [Halobacillus salinarum]|uniref:Restriction endonuclease type IV Mrr domain-containing protein n=1 Tax=Halobacillus salinarum TaxID=2932257 RepID=A0ABY4ETQ9_9BACI|nr:hypothetical protein [Halobacillus salinarum]UOQ45521.1 hypothetical protein MUN89_06140 [Halobacillus salinarum]
MTRYFKFVATRKGKEDWMVDELFQGRARYGWSSPGRDLRKIQDTPKDKRIPEEKVTWKYSQFLINRLQEGDRLVIQLKRPLRQFLIAEVTGPYTSTDTEEDFNHVVPCQLLTPEFVEVEAEAVSQSLRHHLSKRGNYYEIYPEEAKQELDSIVDQAKEPSFMKANQQKRSSQFERKELEDSIITSTYETIARQWPSKYFEQFVADLIGSIPGLEVKKQGDSHLGWDLTMRILDPLTEEPLYEEIPVQCKNFNGKVTTTLPIDDLERSIENTQSPIAYLFILGELTDEFHMKIEERLEELKARYNRDIKWNIIEQDQIARLYLDSLNRESVPSLNE